MCDKKNSVLFTVTECVVLSPDFKLTDKSHVLLKVPRKDNMYSVNLKNIIPQGGLTCLFAKATLDESNLWHRRLGHVNFKTMNKLVRGNLVRGIENLIDLKVKVIRCDNGTEFKNRVMNQFYEIKGIKMEFSVARTPQQNRVAKRKNRTLIEDARTMLANSKLLITLWAEAVNTTCYVQNRVLVIKPQNKTPYELFLGRKPALSFMRPFGCPATILNTIDHLGSGPNWLFDIDTLSKSMNYKPIVARNQSNCNADSKSSPDAGFKPSGEEEKKDAEDLGNEYSDVLSTEEPRVNQEKDDNVSSTNNINTATLNLNDPNMPELEDIVYSDEVENVGAETDMNNLNTFIPVSPIPTTRIHKDHPIEQIIGYLNSTPQTRRMTKSVTGHAMFSSVHKRTNHKDFQNCLFTCFLSQEEPKKVIQALKDPNWIEAMQETLMDFPNGKRAIGIKWVYRNKKDERDPDFPDRVYKVEKALYGLHQAPRAWTASKVEGGWDFISQDKYVTEILKKFSFTNVKTASTPIETQKSLLKDADGKDIDEHLYRSMIGSLMYLTSLRPDIMFAVCACARFQVNPKVSHFSAVKRIFRYLKVKNPVFHSKTKHIKIRHHFIKDSYEKKLIQMIKIHTDQNVTDLLRKAFDVSKFQYLIASTGMLNL
ncbi:uncharacterized mitochondrial protein-like protein [Tanacetum coccineum]